MSRIVLVTGGSRGIGRATVKTFLELGDQVVTCGRNLSTWQKAVEQDAELAAAEFLTVDLSEQRELDELFAQIQNRFGRLDVAINNASPANPATGQYASVDTPALAESLMADFWIPAQCVKHELNLMRAGGSIVNISSVNGLRPTPNAAMYSAAKHALEGLTRSVALEAIQDGIRVNAVAPGLTWTTRWQLRADQSGNPDLRSEMNGIVPAGRFAEPAEIASAIVFLCSERAQYIVGHTLVIDGGVSLK